MRDYPELPPEAKAPEKERRSRWLRDLNAEAWRVCQCRRFRVALLHSASPKRGIRRLLSGACGGRVLEP
jgi:hypothetical protein